MTEQPISISPAEGAQDMGHIRALFREYQEWLGVDLCFQDFEAELANLPGRYAPPSGCLLLARDGADVAGGVGMWSLGAGVCEMKRLYVRSPWRRRGLGRRLSETLVKESIRAGYKSMCLDTLGHLKEARALYRSMGFAEIAAYYDNPLDDVIYMERALDVQARVS